MHIAIAMIALHMLQLMMTTNLLASTCCSAIAGSGSSSISLPDSSPSESQSEINHFHIFPVMIYMQCHDIAALGNH